jgi:hypothetical protein
MMQGKLVDQPLPEFSLFGGPLHRLGCRMGLVRDGTNTVRLGVALALSVWPVLIVLALVQGVGEKIFSLGVIGGHVRFLVAVPLLFICETGVFPRMSEFVREIVKSGMVPKAELPELASLIRRVVRLNDSWISEALFFLVVFALPLIGPVAEVAAKMGNWGNFSEQGEGRLYGVGWYHGICLPLFRFLLMRWLWRLGLWWYFLWRVAKFPLRLVATHPDRAGGLGFLELVQDHFAPLTVAIGAVYSASFAEAISTGTMPFEALGRLVPIVLGMVALLFVCPLFLFSSKLWLCRVNGWSDYMAMASRYVDAFDRRWVLDETATGESQLGTSDLQSLADLGNSMNVVQGMRLIPTSRRLVLGTVGFVLLPMLPLLLLKYPIDQLAAKLLQTLTGF